MPACDGKPSVQDILAFRSVSPFEKQADRIVRASLSPCFSRCLPYNAIIAAQSSF